MRFSKYNNPNKRRKMAQKQNIMVEHENGYRGILYGKHSMLIFKGDKEVLHTDFRNIDTAPELYEVLSEMPSVMEMLTSMNFNDEEGVMKNEET